MQVPSTADVWTSALNNLNTAQQSQQTANNQVSTQKIATDLQGFGSTSEVIASYQSTLAQTNGYLSVANTVSSRLTDQDSALTTTSGAASDAQQSIMSALASGDGTALMTALQGDFSEALDGLNYQSDGQYLFGGGNNSTPPVTVTSLSDLGALPADSANTVFANGSVKKTSQIDANTSVQTGMLASDLGQQMMQTFQDIQQFNDTNSDGPFGANMTAAQKSYLTTKAQEFSSEYTQLLSAQSVNGTNQTTVANTTTSLQGQVTQLQTQVGNITNADLATAYSSLQQAQVAVQASAQVLSTLNQYSLLNYLK
jgi:flagellar hook-associated protein 3 FlgL